MVPTQRLALVGYGRMGRLIEQLAPEQGFEVVLRLDSKNNSGAAGIEAKLFEGIDVAIEFSRPETAPANLKRLAAARIATVAGTTGWLPHLTDIQQTFNQFDTGLVWSPNFSIGVAVFRKLAANAAELLDPQSSYGAWAWEIHHDAKKDAPSGTLLYVLEAMKSAGYSRPIDSSSSRAGKHPGTHEVGFDSAADTITIRHVARSREGFALGALKAAKWVVQHKGVHTFEEVLFGSS